MAVQHVVCVTCYAVTRYVPEVCFSVEVSLRSSDPQAVKVLPNVCHKFIFKQCQCLPLTASTFLILELCQCVIQWSVQPVLAPFLKYLLEQQM